MARLASVRPAGWLTAALVAAGCHAPAQPTLVASTPAPEAASPAAAPAAPPAGAAPARPAPGAPAGGPAAPGAPAPGAAPGGGGAAPGGGGAPQQAEVYLDVPEGPLVNGGVAAPAGMVGTVSLFVPGMVPETIDLPGGALTLRPRPEGAAAVPSGTATVTGQVAGAGAGVQVQYLGPDRQRFAGGMTDASGAYAFTVPVEAGEAGVVVARDSQFIPRLAVARVTIAPGETAAVGALTLADPAEVRASYRLLGDVGDAGPSELAAPPKGLFYTEASVQLAETGARGPWRATLHTTSAVGAMPRYALSGFEQVFQLRAMASGNLAGAEISGPPGGLPGWLGLPALAGLPETLVPGQELVWGAVADAKLYTLRLTRPGQEDAPLWQGATAHNRLTLPSRLAVGAIDAVLRVDAWDSTGVSLYSVASVRQLRLPTESTGPSGRHSWASKAVRLGG